MIPETTLSAGTRLGNYELTALIGQGGMGSVYSAVHLGLGKRVAIKTLRSELSNDPDVRARFLREGKAAAAVRHPNVVGVDDVGIQGDMPYLVMELLEGEDLGSLVARNTRISVSQTVDIVIPVLLAMAEAHRAGVVHRDLKPDNIFLARGYGSLVVPKVLDFGISKLREAQSLGLTGDNALLGTPYYMSPEQAGSARDVDARSDLYSIGVILYHCVSGQVPFGGTSLAHVIGQILHATPIPLRESLPDVPVEFEAVVLKVMSKEPSARYPQAIALAQALLPFASHRMQVTFGPELGAALGDTAMLAPPSAATKAAAPADSSTLAAHSVPAERSRRSVPRWALLVLAAAVAGLALWIVQSRTVVRGVVGTVGTVPVVAVAQPSAPFIPPLPAPTAAAPVVPASAALVPSVPGALPPIEHGLEAPAEPPPTAAATAASESQNGKRVRGRLPKSANRATPQPSAAQPNDDVWGDRK